MIGYCVFKISYLQATVQLLMVEFLQVANIEVKLETPVDHGEIICFSIYSGPDVDFGNGKSCVWVDVLDGGGKELLMEFAPFFEDTSIKKVAFSFL